jgi:hypothetical protein
MKTMKSGILITTLLASALLAGQQENRNAEQQLQAAIHKEEVTGDLRGAIELYKSISAQSGGDRTVAATALLRMGECQEKLGQSQAAHSAYARVLRQFGDQVSISAVARGKLEDLAPRNRQSQGPPFGVATATFPVEAAAGKHVKYSGYIRTEFVTEGWAGLWWRVDGEPGHAALAFDNMQDRGAMGTTSWMRYVIELDVPVDARNINFGVLHSGNGTAWFDTLQVELNGVPYSDASRFDLDFESNLPRGFYTGGQGYRVQLDRQVAHTGHQSLRSEFVGTGRQTGSNGQNH